MTKIFQAFFCILLLASCTPVIKAYYGIHKPRIENKNSIQKFALKHDLDTQNIRVLDFDGWMNRIENVQNWPAVYVFNNHGESIQLKQDTGYCNGPTFKVVAELNPSTSYIIDATEEASYHFSHLRSLKGIATPIELTDEYDFYVVIYWATFLGKMNDDQTYDWEQSIKKNKNAKIKLVKVNLDLQEFWDNKTDLESIEWNEK